MSGFHLIISNIFNCLTFPGFIGSHLKDILRKNVFPIKLVDNCIKTFFEQKCLAYSSRIDCWKKIILYWLTILGNFSLALTARLQNCINKYVPYCNIKVIFKSTTRLSNFFCFKDKLSFDWHSNVDNVMNMIHQVIPILHSILELIF